MALTQALRFDAGYEMSRSHCLLIVLAPEDLLQQPQHPRLRRRTPRFDIARLGVVNLDLLRGIIPQGDGLRDHFDECVLDIRSPDDGWCTALAVLWFLSAEGQSLHISFLRGTFEHRDFAVIPNWIQLLLE